MSCVYFVSAGVLEASLKGKTLPTEPSGKVKGLKKKVIVKMT